MPDKFGFKVKKMTTEKWGINGGISGGGTRYNQIQLNQKFGMPRKPEKNVTTDKPYDAQI